MKKKAGSRYRSGNPLSAMTPARGFNATCCGSVRSTRHRSVTRVTELVLLNSHDGSSSFQLDLGLFRLVCSNGMVTPISDADGLRFRHGKDVVNSVIEGVYDLVDETPKLAERFDRFNAITLDRDEQALYARTALALRYGEDWEQTAAVLPSAMLDARRATDVGDSLWLTMNRVQENLLRGGVRGPFGDRASGTHAGHPFRPRGRTTQPRAVAHDRGIRGPQGRLTVRAF